MSRPISPPKTPKPVAVVAESFIQVPRSWFASYENALFDEAKGIPPTFVVFLMRLWSRTMNGNMEREADFSVRQFGIRKDEANRWMRAVAVSGLFVVTKGKYSPNSPMPSEFKYEADATDLDWRCFLLSLAETLRTEKEQRVDKRGNLSAFQIVLAERVDETRRMNGLPAVNEEFLAQAIASGKARRAWDGTIQVDVTMKPEFERAA
jgi:hypothetical protein